MAQPVVDHATALLNSLSSNLTKLYPETTRSRFTSPLTSLGLLTTGYLAYNFLSFLGTYLRPATLTKYQHGKRYSTWALVTGASDGIGLGFAEALLSRGFNVLLHGRNPTKLEGVQKRLAAQFPDAQIRTVIADAGAADADIEGVVRAATSLPGKLTILVNNVGGVPYGDPFASLEAADPRDVDSIINLNLRFPTQLTKALLPELQKNEPTAVLSLGSGAAVTPIPFLSVYCGTKAFNTRWSDSLRTEMRALGKDVDVLALYVGSVQSGGNKTETGLFTPTSIVMANAGLDRIGGAGGIVWGYWRHALQFSFLGSIPDGVQRGLLVKLAKQLQDTVAGKKVAKGPEAVVADAVKS